MAFRSEISRYKISRIFIGIIQAFGWVAACGLFLAGASQVPFMARAWENERAWSVCLYIFYGIFSIIAGGVLHAFMAAILAIFDIADDVHYERADKGKSARREAN